MTWADLFRRAWRVLRVRFARQHMCPECGDALTYDYHPGWTDKQRRCVACDEWREMERRKQAQQRGAEMAQNTLRRGYSHLSNLVAAEAATAVAQQNAGMLGALGLSGLLAPGTPLRVNYPGQLSYWPGKGPPLS